jgi:hypothetical protein
MALAVAKPIPWACHVSGDKIADYQFRSGYVLLGFSFVFVLDPVRRCRK